MTLINTLQDVGSVPDYAVQLTDDALRQEAINKYSDIIGIQDYNSIVELIYDVQNMFELTAPQSVAFTSVIMESARARALTGQSVIPIGGHSFALFDASDRFEDEVDELCEAYEKHGLLNVNTLLELADVSFFALMCAKDPGLLTVRQNKSYLVRLLPIMEEVVSKEALTYYSLLAAAKWDLHAMASGAKPIDLQVSKLALVLGNVIAGGKDGIRRVVTLDYDAQLLSISREELDHRISADYARHAGHDWGKPSSLHEYMATNWADHCTPDREAAYEQQYEGGMNNDRYSDELISSCLQEGAEFEEWCKLHACVNDYQHWRAFQVITALKNGVQWECDE